MAANKDFIKFVNLIQVFKILFIKLYHNYMQKYK
jgi:hypothetical protein